MREIVLHLSLIVSLTSLCTAQDSSQNLPQNTTKEQSPSNNIKVITDNRSFYVSVNGDKSLADGILTFTGHTFKDSGAASRDYDALIFEIDNYPEAESDFLGNRIFSDESPDGKWLIYLTVPHAVDPGHLIKRSTRGSQVSVAIICSEFEKGGWNDSNKVILFNKIKDLTENYVDDFTDEQYKHYYDGR